MSKMRKFKITIEASVSEELLAEKAERFAATSERFAALSDEDKAIVNIDGFLGSCVGEIGERALRSEVVFAVGDEFTLGQRTDTDFFAVVNTEEVVE